MIISSPTLASSSTTTVARVACTTGLSRLGCVIITPGRFSGPEVEDITAMTLQSSGDLRTGRPRMQGACGPRRAGYRRAGGVRSELLAGVVELVDTPALGAGGPEGPWGFESLRPHLDRDRERLVARGDSRSTSRSARPGARRSAAQLQPDSGSPEYSGVHSRKLPVTTPVPAVGRIPVGG